MFIGLLVSSTFAADVPLTSSALRIPGDFVATLMMFHGPLFALLVFGILFKWYQGDIPRLAYAFTMFVGTTVLSALFGGGPDTNVALWFSLHVLVGLLVYLVTVWTIQRTSISLYESIRVFLLAVCAQAFVGIAQLIRQRPFGLWELGEAGMTGIRLLTVPLLGSIKIGTYVSGFTGMSFQLSNLLLLMFPLLVVGYLRIDGWKRIVPVGGALAFALLIRASASDAARGAFFVEILAFGALIIAVFRPSPARISSSLQASISRISQRVVATIAVLLLLLYPSSGSNRATKQSGSSDLTSNTSGTGETTGTGPKTAPQGTGVYEQVESLSIPFFDLSNLGARVNQYLAGMDIFLQYPLFGLGGGNFVLVGHQYGIASPEYTDVTDPIHSIYISLLAETGIIGFTSFALTIGFIYLYGYRSARTQNTDAIVPIALLAGLSATLAFMFFDKFLLTNATDWAQFWIIAAFITVIYQQDKNKTRSGTS
jgi:hypothetical protein